MTQEDLQQISNLLNQKFAENNKRFEKIDQRFEAIDRFQEFAIKEFKENRIFQKFVVEKLDKLEKGQQRLENQLIDFQEDVKQDQKYSHDRINEGFKNIAEQMVQLFAHEGRITSLEHQVARMSAFVPIQGEPTFVEKVEKYRNMKH